MFLLYQTLSSDDERDEVQGKVYFHVVDAVKLNWREHACVMEANEHLYSNSTSQVSSACPFLREKGCRKH